MERRGLHRSAPWAAFLAVLVAAPVAFTAPSRAASVQQTPRAFADPKDLAAGKLLVARRGLGDGNFSETVVLLFAYAAKDGAAGVIVNRRTKTSVRRLIPDLNATVGAEPTLFVGGPVDPGSVRGLARSRIITPDVVRVLPDVMLLTSRAALERTLEDGATPDDLRLFAGYSGWGPGQLEREVQRGDWYIANGTSDVVFASDPERVWRRQIQISDVLVL